MIACTRCGRWHLDAEKAAGKRLSCTEVKQYWEGIRQEHQRQTRHRPRISVDRDGEWACMECSAKLILPAIE